MTHISRDYPMHHCKRCGAKTRRGTMCLSPAMANGRCRMHGGLSLAGQESPRYRHGWYTRAAIAQRSALAAVLRHATNAVRHVAQDR